MGPLPGFLYCAALTGSGWRPDPELELMKIVHILLTPRFAGTERHALELANAQAQVHDVTMILHRRGAQVRPNAIAHRLDPRVKVELVGGWSFFASWAARRKVKAIRPDVAHAHLSLACRALHGLKGLCLRVGTLHINFKAQQHGDLDALIAIAPWQLPAVPPALREHTVQINNWTSATACDPAARQRLRSELGLAEDEWVIGTLGRTEPSKGLDLLLAAYLAVRPELATKTRLVLAGQGRGWAALRRMAPPEVLMPGFVSRPQDWFSCFDVFVSAARSEPFGLVFLEAMAAGLPVLASRSQGAQLLARQIGRPLLPVGDKEALAVSLKEISQTRPARQVYDLSEYSLERAVAAVETFYRRELKGLAHPLVNGA